MPIRRLPEGTVNRIAAGEVVERPASVVKELVENAIDAEAKRIDVAFRGGGRTLIRVRDDGIGMNAGELDLAVERHATSKLADDDLIRIETLGFRGEALPSIGAVARLAIASRARGSVDAHAIAVEGGRKGAVKPAALNQGTEIEVRDLFYAVPARLKFLKSQGAETAEAADVVRRLALAHPQIGFSFTSEERRLIDVPPNEDREARIGRLLGADFIANAVRLDAGREAFGLTGYAGKPAWSRAQANLQFVFVNGRPVRDKLLAGAIKGAYADLMMRGRHPAVALFLDCPPDEVDVNVHPAKAEVRFRDGGLVRGLIVGAIRQALSVGGATPGLARAAVRSFRPESPPSFAARRDAFMAAAPAGFAEEQAPFAMDMPSAARVDEAMPNGEHPLGVARAQMHRNYIVAQTADGMVLIDQHAAHERLVYERLKRERAARGVVTQPLLIPEIVELGADAERLAAMAPLLAEVGVVIDAFGEGAVVVREVPAALEGGDIAGLVKDIADDLAELGSTTAVEDKINRLLATTACHHSVRAGRSLRVEEMNALLREMEATPNSGSCNHGRPTWIELKLSDIERLFGR
jgi:DNA mismatch repair protein MutL